MSLLFLIALILVILWAGGFALSIGGALIHILIVLAVIVFLYELLIGVNNRRVL